MASAPFPPSAPGPPQSARSPGTLEWGASVHGSSACLEAMNEVSSSDLSAGATVHHAHPANSWQHGTHADCSPAYPGGVQCSPYGYSDHNSHVCAQLGAIHAASGHPPQFPSWQPAGCSSQYPHAYDPHAQYYQYQNPYQFVWQSYHCHSAVQDPAAALGGGDAYNGWKGWASYSGARSNPPADGPGQQHYHMQGYGQMQSQDCSQGYAPGPQHQQQQQQVADEPSSDDASAKVRSDRSERSDGPSAIAVIGPYDPMADADALTEPCKAALICAISPSSATSQAASAPGDHAPGTAASAASSGCVGKCANGGGGALQGVTVAASPASPMAAAAAAAAVTMPLTEAPAAAAAAAAAATDTMAAAAPAAPAVDLIVVWDLDETLIIFNSLMNGRFVKATTSRESHNTVAGAIAAVGEVDPTSGSVCGGVVSGGIVESELPNDASALGHRLAEMVYHFCDDHMAFKMLDVIDPVSFMELWSLAAEVADSESSASSKPGTGRVLGREHLERIAEIYTGGLGGHLEMLGEAWYRSRESVMVQAEELTNGWVAAARQLLTGVMTAARVTAAASRGTQERPILAFHTVRHVLVSAGHFIATLGKLVLWGLNEHFDIRDVYSASGRSKLEIFRSLHERFGPTAAYTAVGDGREEERAATVLGWGFVRVGLAVPPPAPSASQPLGQGQGQGQGPDEFEPWRVPRPVQMIRPDDVLEAARRAY